MTPEITELEPNITLITTGEKQVYLVGTAHISRASVELVETAIRRYRPELVCLELCDARYQALRNPDSWRDTDVYQVIKKGKGYVLFAQLALAAFQKKLAAHLDTRPGEEMRRAMTVADELGIPIAVVDRDIKTSLKRAWGKAGLWSLIRIVASLIASLFSKEQLSAETVEELKQGDMLASMIAEFDAALPGMKEVLLDERDRYMAAKIGATGAKTALAVVGAGHTPGLKRLLGTAIDVSSLETLPPPRVSLQILKWSVPVLFALLIIYGFVHSGAETSAKMIWSWVVSTGGFAALGALFALPHPLTIVSAFLAAPFTTLHPLIAAGWVCGLVEAALRKPRVRDFETIAEDMTTYRGIWRNRVSKIILVMAFANLGAMVGAIIGAGKLAAFL